MKNLVLGRSSFVGCVLTRQEITPFYGKRSSIWSLSNERRVA